MIIGIGSDLCNIERIQNSLDRFGDRFLNRVFTDVERAKAARRPFTAADREDLIEFLDASHYRLDRRPSKR